MHDTQLPNLCGWPDLVSTSSVVRCIKQSVPISMPNAFSTTTWDCHVVGWNWFQNLACNTFTRTNNIKAVGGSAANATGGVMAYAVVAGQPLAIATAPVVAQITLDPSYTIGSARIIGIGVEVINTTSDLNRQGTVTVWRQEQASQEVGLLAAYSGPNIVYAQDYTFVRPPPFSVANAMLYPGSRQWKAADGCYLVGTFTAAENPPTFVSYIQPAIPVIIQDDSETVGVATYNNSTLLSPVTLTLNTVPNCSQAIRLHPLNMLGSMFTGLSVETTLTLNVNIYYESFPSVAEAGILVLAKPSAAYDPVALEFMSRINSSLPVGVPASWNPAGEWFWEIVNDLVDMAPQIGGLFGAPGAMLGKGIKSGYDALTNRYSNPEGNAAREMTRQKRREAQLAAQKPKLLVAPGASEPKPTQPGQQPRRQRKAKGQAKK